MHLRTIHIPLLLFAVLEDAGFVIRLTEAAKGSQPHPVKNATSNPTYQINQLWNCLPGPKNARESRFLVVCSSDEVI